MEELSRHFFRHGRLFYFRTPGKFTRWMFEQRRGSINPWAVLVTGWREAKPCASAIAAARSGCPSGLRPDARLSQLRAPEGGSQQHVNIAVATMVVLLDSPQRESRAVLWAKGEGAQTTGFQIHIARNLEQLQRCMASLLAVAVPGSAGEVLATRTQAVDSESSLDRFPRALTPHQIDQPPQGEERCMYIVSL
jgi:hypothetical protein